MDHEPERTERSDWRGPEIAMDFESSSTVDMSNRLWVIGLHLAAARRWLAQVPPKVDEVVGTLQVIEETNQQIGIELALTDPPGAIASRVGGVVYRACA